MKDWIDRCTRGRVQAVQEGNILKKSFYKLVINSVFGKTIERQSSQRQFELVNNREDALSYASNPRVLKKTFISSDLLLIELQKKSVVLDKPLFIGRLKLYNDIYLTFSLLT